MSATEVMDQIYCENAESVLRYLVSRCGSRELSEDLCGLVFEQALLRVGQGRADEITTPWLMAVARRRLIDHWRRTERASVSNRMLTTQARSTERAEPIGYEIVDALHRIRPNHSRSLYLKYVLDLPTASVAAQMGMSYRAAESVLRRARAALRVELESGGNGEWTLSA